MNLSRWTWAVFGVAVAIKLIELFFFDGLYLQERFYASILRVIFWLIFVLVIFVWAREGNRRKLQKQATASIPPPVLIDYIKEQLASGLPRDLVDSRLKTEKKYTDIQIANAFIAINQNLQVAAETIAITASNGYLFIRYAMTITLLLYIPSLGDYYTGWINLEKNKILLQEGLELAELGNDAGAIEKWEQILKTEKNPKIVAPVYIALGGAYFSGGYAEEGVRYCHESLLIDPTIMRKGRVFEICKVVLISDPRYVNLVPEEERLFIQSQQYFEEGNREKSLELLEQVVSFGDIPHIQATSHLLLGMFYRVDGDFEKAKRHCRIGVDMDATIESKEYLNKDPSGKTAVDFCARILKGE